MLETLAGLEAGTIQPVAQDDGAASLAPILRREDALVDFALSAREIYNRWRGFQPWPGAYTYFRGRKLTLHRLLPAGATHLPPGELTVEQPSKHTHIGNMKYEWDLRLSDRVPLDIHVNFGAGQAQLDLGSLDLRGVQLDMGVGQLQMDLRGNPKHDYNVRISGGVGEATVRLPENAGIDARASGGIGDISVRGLRKQGDRWLNDAYDAPGVKIHVDVQGGIGSIHLIAD